MKISWFTNTGDFNLHSGYGIAGYNIVKSMQSLGHIVPYNDPACQAQINFCWPTWFEDVLRPTQYSIAYTPWESTDLPERWLDIFNACDEVWTTSQWIANIYHAAGVVKPIVVYEHGISPEWRPFKRSTNAGVLRFLHQGEPAPRKGAQLAYDAFKAAFGDSSDVQLTIKAHRMSTVRTGQGITFGPPGGNVRVLSNHLDENDLIGLYHNHHVMVYPSYGEGFGLIPLQALATGMPTICTAEWAPYGKYLPLGVDSSYVDSHWPDIHPGKMTEPNFDDLVDKYRYVYDNYQEQSTIAFSNSFKIHDYYDWAKLTKTAVDSLETRLNNLG